MLQATLSVGTLVFTICAVMIVVLWTWFQWSHRDLIRLGSELPCTIKRIPIVGHAHYTLRRWKEVTRFAIDYSMDAVSNGLYNVCFWGGPLPIVMIHKAEDIQKILTTSSASEKGEYYEYLKYAAKNGLLTAPGHIWKTTRRHINPLFHPRNVEQLMPTFNSNSRQFLSILSDHVGRAPLNVMRPAMSIGLKTVCQLIFGPDIEFDIESEEFRGLMTVVERIPNLFSKRVIRVWLRVDAIFQFLYHKDLSLINKLWQNFTEAPLKMTKANNKKKSLNQSLLEEGPVDQTEGILNLLDVYSVLQKNHPQFTEDDLKSEMLVLYCTGTDTVGAALSSCLLLLAQYQDIQEHLFREISSVVGDEDDVTVQDISRMSYLEQVYKETLRWSTLVPYIGRKVSDDLKLSTCTIPAGCSVTLGLIGPHMDPSIYPEPRKFDPERFSPENVGNREKNAFLPFSGGPRGCIGKMYSEMLIKTMLVHVLRRYRVSTDMDVHNMKLEFTVTLVSPDGYNVKFDNRRCNKST